MQINKILFDKAIECVTSGLGVTVDHLLSSRAEAATSARSLLISMLSEVGFTDIEIASRLSMSRQAINKLRHGLQVREMNSWSFRMQSCQIRKEYATLKQRIIAEATR
jgi:hypothetical protein